jgi:hypothetical protein
MNKNWKSALANTRLEYPDWQPDEEYLELVNKIISGELTAEQVIRILIDKYKIN